VDSPSNALPIPFWLEKLLNRRFPAALFLSALVLALYAQVLTHHFLNLDDDAYITANPHVLGAFTWANVRWAFTAFHSGHWHPLTWISLALDKPVLGLNPGRMIFENAVFHAANAIFVFAILRAATKRTWESFCTALIFALHPLRIESVAWAAERKDVLSAFFALGACYFYARPNSPKYKTTLCLTAGLLCKPTVAIVPALFVILDFWPLQRKLTWTQSLREKIVWVALSVAAAAAMLAAQRTGGGLAEQTASSLTQRAANAACSYVWYLQKLVLPQDLGVFYPLKTVGALRACVCVIILALITIFTWRRRAERPYLWAGAAWFFIGMLPTIGLIQVGSQARADRFTYLPLIGPVFAVVWSWESLLKVPILVRRIIPVSAAVAYAAVAWVQIGYWTDSETLFRRTLSVAGSSALIESNLGVVLSEHGAYEEAAEHYRAALRDSPRYAEALNNYGVYFARRGDLANAREYLSRAVAAAPDVARFHYNEGLTWVSRDDEQAVTQFRRAVALDPAYAQAWLTLGKLQERRGNIEPALTAYERAAALQPGWADASGGFQRMLQRAQ
jgi:Tfp pilus assembly protein PilF